MSECVDDPILIPGPTGPTGPQGPKGDQGLQGPSGNDGADGADGAKGDKGDQGIQGPKGDQGNDGLDGSPGTPGPIGPVGSPGIDGAKGDTGDTGADGRGYNSLSSSNIDLDTLGTTISSAATTVEKAYVVGSRIRFAEASDPENNYFEGIVTSYNPATGVMDVGSINVISGSGTYSSWNLTITGEAPILKTKRISISSAQILSGNTSPVDLKSSPGSGKMIDVIGSALSMTFNTAAYATNLNVVLETDTSNSPQIRFTNGLELTSGSKFIKGTLVTEGGDGKISLIDDKKLVFKVEIGDPTLGDSGAVLYIYYIETTI